jgi:RimJ/RimL family protein N-acetyltransferase
VHTGDPPGARAALAARIEEGFERDGYGLWAVEVVDRTPFAGFVGLARVDIDVAFAPAVELGWRQARDQWGRGIASEAATAAATFALRDLALPEVLAYTSVRNKRSRAVMTRLGMTHDPTEDFAHPSLPATHPLSAHVLYRLTAERLATG